MENLFNPFSLHGKTILVTGASSGIGKAIAVYCSKLGAHLIITGQNETKLRATFSELKGDNQYIIADLTKSTDVQKLATQVPNLDGIVHCAGIGSRIPCKMISKINIDEVMGINFDAPVLIQTALLGNKKINKGASIVFLSSRAANTPSIGNAIYSASKGAILSYAKCLALELSNRLIRVNCVCPGMVWTDLILKDGISEEQLHESELKYPLKRFGNVEDIAYLVIYLLSDASLWMTGSAIDISGGGEGVLTL